MFSARFIGFEGEEKSEEESWMPCEGSILEDRVIMIEKRRKMKGERIDPCSVFRACCSFLYNIDMSLIHDLKFCAYFGSPFDVKRVIILFDLCLHCYLYCFVLISVPYDITILRMTFTCLISAALVSLMFCFVLIEVPPFL